MANYSLNFDFGTCTVGPLGRGKKPSRLQEILGDEPFENSLLEQISLINKAIFQAPAPSYTKSTHPWSPADCVWLDSMAGYHFPAVLVRYKRGPAVRTVIHCHANACDIGHIYELCQRDAECWRANVLLVEYPGYGASPGVPYERSVDRHVTVAYGYLTEELRLASESIVLFGRSLGSGPVCRLAQRLQEMGSTVGGVILHSPFISVKEVGVALLGGVARIMSDRWDNRAPLTTLKTRVLIIHGASDEVIPFAHAETLRDIRVRNGLHVTFVPTQGTHNYFSYYRDYLHPVENFLTSTTHNGKQSNPGRALPPMPDPLPMAKYSKAQVWEIMELRRKTREQESYEADAKGRAGPVAGAGHRETSPNSTLVEGEIGYDERSGPTSSDDETEPARNPGRRVVRRDSLDLLDAKALASAGHTPAARKTRWRKGHGRDTTRKNQTSGSYDDDDASAKIPGGASPFGSKMVATTTR